MIQSLDRGLAIVEYLSRHKSAGVTELANEFGINKSTASRIMATLTKHNIVCKNSETQKYRLSLGTLLLSHQALNSQAIAEAVRPVLVRLSEQTRENAHLCALEEDKLYRIDQVKSARNRYLKDTALPGMVEPFHCSAAGKVILAHMPGAKVRRILEENELYRYTEKTNTNTDDLIAEFARVRQNGYAVDSEEFMPGVACIAVAVPNEWGMMEQAISISGSASILVSERALEKNLPLLLDAARRLTEQYRIINQGM
ncbi:MAG: IclR family transcriptional regulator [Clostridiales bacterium]|nr:IclR family transcriptional regulator [Clostridiales bacterium]